MDRNQYLLKLQKRLIFKLPASSLRELLTDTEGFLREEENTGHSPKFGTYREFARDIAPEKNFRLILAILCAISFIFFSLLFWIGYTGYSLPFAASFMLPFGVIVPGAVLLWLVLGINCLWDSCYNYDRKKLLRKQLCLFFTALAVQLILLFVFPEAYLAGYFPWSDGLYWGSSLLCLLGMGSSLIKIVRGQFQSYFTLLQITGIFLSLIGYNRYLGNMDIPVFYQYPFFMIPYFISLAAALISFFILEREVEHGRSN